jgi:transposase
MNELSVTDRETILGLLRLGWSIRRVARETGRRHETIRRYGQDAGILQPRAAPAKPHTRPKVPTDLESASAAMAAPTVSRSSVREHAAYIEAELTKGRNAVAIYQDLVEHHAYDGSYDAVKRYARHVRPSDPKVSCRFETEPGWEAQVDYGEGAPTRDPRTGKYRKPRLFVMTLSASRHAFRKVVARSSQQTWCELHEEAFAYFGGAVKTIRLDNLREGVIDPDLYDPELNGLYATMLAHYGVIAIPCRPYAPDLKGKVESAVGYTQRTALKGRRFESLDEQNIALMRWNERWAFTRIHGTTKRQVREMFEEERPALLPLPLTRFEYYRIVERRVHGDAHIEVDGAYYSAPPRYVGTSVIVHVGRLWLRILDSRSKQCVREHVTTQRGRRRTVDSDLPKQTPPQVHRIVAHVGAAGPSARAFAQAMEAERGALALRSLFGLADLIKRYGFERVDRVCALAMSAGTLRLRFLRKALAINTTPSLLDEHNVIESINTYGKHFAILAQGVPLDD